MNTLVSSVPKNDQTGYNAHYKNRVSEFIKIANPDEYIKQYLHRRIAPYYAGGHSKGYVRGLAWQFLAANADATNRPRNQITVLDAGCGLGEFSVFLACNGFNVVGVDISHEGCASARQLASGLGMTERCTFLAESLELLSLPSHSVDFVIGFGTLHHFIKYNGVPIEFQRIMKPGAVGYFADSFGENKIYHLFHNKKAMERLGDVILTKQLIDQYFENFDVDLVPTDWFTMFDKLFEKARPAKRYQPLLRKMSRLLFRLDRCIPPQSRLAVYLSGAVVTKIQRRTQN